MALTLASARYSEPAPTWIPIVAFAVPALIVLAVLIPALRKRRRYKKARQAQKSGIQASTVALDSAESIGDGGDYSTEALLRAMSIAEEDWGPTGDLPHNEGAPAEALGLKAKIGDATEVLEPTIYWGSRPQGQVFIRMGPDEKIAGGTELYSNRHIRQIVTLRASAPEFLMGVKDGRPAIVEGNVPGLDATLARIKPNPAVWDGFAAKGGSEGMVTSRSAVDQPGFWAYDLWLLERIARDAALTPLGEARIGPAWTIPYGAGRKAIDV